MNIRMSRLNQSKSDFANAPIRHTEGNKNMDRPFFLHSFINKGIQTETDMTGNKSSAQCLFQNIYTDKTESDHTDLS